MTPPALALLARLRAQGVELVCKPDPYWGLQLVVRGATRDKLLPGDEEAITEHKTALLMRIHWEAQRERNLNEALYGPPQPGKTPDGRAVASPLCCGVGTQLTMQGWQCAQCGQTQTPREA